MTVVEPDAEPRTQQRVRAGTDTNHTPRPERFDAYAVETRSGPHVTMQAGLLHAGRYWTTTSADSLKAKSVAKHSQASAVIHDHGGVTIVHGRTTMLRLTDPLRLIGDPTAPLRAPLALLRLGVDQAEQLLGYLEVAGNIPSGWLPHQRALLVTRPDRSLTIRDGRVVAADGDWGTPVPIRPAAAMPRHDLPASTVPASHRGVLVDGAAVHVGVPTVHGPIALPGRWVGDDRFDVPADALAHVGVCLPGPGAVTFHDSVSRRPDEKIGVMFRGEVEIVAIDDFVATLRLSTVRVTTWDGFEATTRSVSR